MVLNSNHISQSNSQSSQHKITTSLNLKTTLTESKRMEDRHWNSKQSKEWLIELDRQIIQNISKMNFTIDDLAVYMNISKRQLYRLINERIGETPHTYLKNYRLNHAKKLLENKEVDSVKVAAYSTGFPNTVYFSRQFKASFGYLPSDLL
jgi:transcriptional regulator GlxA family with amidase domain